MALYLTTLETLSGKNWFEWCQRALSESVTNTNAAEREQEIQRRHAHWGYASEPHDGFVDRYPINWNNWVDGVYKGYSDNLTKWDNDASQLLVPLLHLERTPTTQTRTGHRLNQWVYRDMHVQRSPQPGPSDRCG